MPLLVTTIFDSHNAKNSKLLRLLLYQEVEEATDCDVNSTQHQHQLEDQHAHQNTLRVDSLVASCVCFAEDGVSGMVKCRVTRCSSADGQVLADDDMDSDTSWVEEVVFLLKHKDGHFTWQSGA